MFTQLKSLSYKEEIQRYYLEFPRLQATIIAIAILPIEVEIEEWFPLLTLDCTDNVSFSNEKIATEFAVIMTTCIKAVDQKIESNEAIDLCLNDDGALFKFAQTFFDVTYHYHKYWDSFVEKADEETAGIFQTTQLLICKLAKIMEDDPEQKALFEQLPSEAEIEKILPNLLSMLGNRSKSL